MGSRSPHSSVSRRGLVGRSTGVVATLVALAALAVWTGSASAAPGTGPAATTTSPAATGTAPTTTTTTSPAPAAPTTTTTTSPASQPASGTASATPSVKQTKTRTTPRLKTKSAITWSNPTAPAPTATLVPVRDTSYWLVASDGGIFAFGGAPFYGSMGGIKLTKPVVGMAATATHRGYWEVASDGGIFTFGTAPFEGSMGGRPLAAPVVGMAPTPTGEGYWEVASDGGIFAFGTAQFWGSAGNLTLAKPVVGMAATPTGLGYWLVASDGGIFAYGAAQFYGSTGDITLNSPIVGMTPTPTSRGYWMVAADGGMFSYGTAAKRFYGSLGAVPLKEPIVGMSSLYNGRGYWMTNDNGAVSNFGTATYWGSAPQQLNNPVVGIATAAGDGDPGGTSFQSGSYGYDVSNYQCGDFPPAPHAIGVVEVEGASFGTVNPCLSQEVQWAGGGLNLYLFLTFGKATTSADVACGSTATPKACNYGYKAAVYAYTKAAAVVPDPAVGWWLDIEGTTTYWSATTGANDSLIQGAINALNDTEGLNQVGIYSSGGVWPSIAGKSYRPSVLYWAADWDKKDPATLCAQLGSEYPDVPSGPLAMVQYSSPSYTFESGGMDTLYDDDYAC